MKKIRKGCSTGTELPSSVESVEGELNIAELFKSSCEELYNSASSSEEMVQLLSTLNGDICGDDKEEVEKISANVVKEAVLRLKPKKSDVSGSFISDAFKVAPVILFHQIAVVFRSWLYHGTVTKNLLACSFLPLLKSSTKDASKLTSYRAIAGSSLVLNIFETVIL